MVRARLEAALGGSSELPSRVRALARASARVNGLRLDVDAGAGTRAGVLIGEGCAESLVESSLDWDPSLGTLILVGSTMYVAFGSSFRPVPQITTTSRIPGFVAESISDASSSAGTGTEARLLRYSPMIGRSPYSFCPKVSASLRRASATMRHLWLRPPSISASE